MGKKGQISREDIISDDCINQVNKMSQSIKVLNKEVQKFAEKYNIKLSKVWTEIKKHYENK